MAEIKTRAPRNRNIIEEVQLTNNNITSKIEEREAQDKSIDQLHELQAQNNQTILMEKINRQFRVVGQKFHFKDQPDTVAFQDKGKRIISAHNDDRVVQAMVTMAEAKDWHTIKVSGHREFQRKVWLEASMRDINVYGYKPTEQEVKQLEERREQKMKNIVALSVDGTHRKDTVKSSDKEVLTSKIAESLKPNVTKAIEKMAMELIDSVAKNPQQHNALEQAITVRLMEREKQAQLSADNNQVRKSKSLYKELRAQGLLKPYLERDIERTR